MLSKTATSACALALLALASSAAYAHEPFDKRTYFTFNQPVQLPGVVLPPGEYIFRLADPETSRKVVQVLSANRKEVYAMLHTLPRQRAEAPDKPEIRFMETAAGNPPAIQTWWYQGERTGREFMYSKEQAARIATAIAAGQPPITMARNEATEVHIAEALPAEREVAVQAESRSAQANVENPEVSANDMDVSASNADVNADKPEAIANADANNRPVGTSGSAEQGAVGTSGQGSNELPRTAGELPLVGLIGLLALGSGLGIRRLVRARM